MTAGQVSFSMIGDPLHRRQDLGRHFSGPGEPRFVGRMFHRVANHQVGSSMQVQRRGCRSFYKIPGRLMAANTIWHPWKPLHFTIRIRHFWGVV